MNCIRFKDRLPLLVLGELDPKEQEELERHIATCEECRKELEDLQEITAILNDEGRESLAELEQLRLENEIYRKLAVKALKENAPATGRVFKLLVRVAAVLVVFLAGYAAYPLFTRQADYGPLNTRLEKNLDDETELMSSLGSRRLTAQGFLIIAKGKNALSGKNPVTSHGDEN